VTDLLQRVERSIQERRLLRRGGRLLVAVSGGLDSTVLLRLLHELSARHRWRLTVAHFNHRLRGRSSDADEELVRQTARALKLRFVAGRADVRSFARKSGLSIEMAARKLRHEFLARVARDHKIRTVAVAHHANDQVELFFVRLFRGAGGEGLAGMKGSAPSPADPKIRLVRPLLDASKDELRRFASEKRIRFREDATNVSTDCLRNRIRHELLPLLRRRYQPALDKIVLRLMEITGAEADFTGGAARQWLGSSGREPAPSKKSQSRLTSAATLSDNVFASLPVALQRRVVQSQLVGLGVVADFELVEQLRKTAGEQLSAGPGFFVLRDEAGRVGLRTQASASFNAAEAILKLAGRAGGAVFDGLRLDWQRQNQAGSARPRRQAGRELFDADRVGGGIALRHWRPGDRFQPIGLASPVKLQDLFTNLKIPRVRRRELMVAAAADGEIFWVEGLRISENFKLTSRTKRRLVWRWRAA